MIKADASDAGYIISIDFRLLQGEEKSAKFFLIPKSSKLNGSRLIDQFFLLPVQINNEKLRSGWRCPSVPEANQGMGAAFLWWAGIMPCSF